LLGSGWSYAEVVEALLLDEETLRSYVKRYRTGGLDALLNDNYKGGQSKLSVEQFQALDLHLQEHTYLSVEGIIAHVIRVYGVSYTVSGMTDLLHQLGFSYKKAKVIPGKAKAEEQRNFLEELEALKATLGEYDKLYYVDGAHPQHNTVASYGWIKTGQNKEIKANTGRSRINLNGALDSDTHEVVVREDSSINAQSTIALLKTLEAKNPFAAVIYVICDNAKYYRSVLVKSFLETSKVKLVFLPPYSPNLNLIERLWKLMRREKMYNQYYEKFSDFKEAIMSFFVDISTYKKKLETLLTENFQILDASNITP
jgi:transposase